MNSGGRFFLIIPALMLLLCGCGISAGRRASYVVALAAVGDISGSGLFKKDEDPFQNVRGILSDKDIFLFNAEGVYSSELTVRECQKFTHQTPYISSPVVLSRLPKARATVASLGNTHPLDCGAKGLQVTTGHMRKRGILTVGAGMGKKEACSPLVVRTGTASAAVLSFLDTDVRMTTSAHDKAGAASWDECDGPDRIEEAAKSADVTVAMIHSTFGGKRSDRASTRSMELAERAIDAGADIVILSGSRVPQGVMKKGKGIAVFGLGDFLLRPASLQSRAELHAFVALFSISEDRLSLELHPLRSDAAGRPEPVSESEGKALLEKISALSAEMGTAVEIIDGRGVVEVERR